MNKDMETGLTFTASVKVTEANTAATLGSGDLQVFATPAMVALMENAAMLAVAPQLGEGGTTVGALMNTTHIKPSALGDTVSATAILKEVEGRKLTFEVKAEDSKGVIGEGTHVRYIVNREKFMSKLG
jgi:predicted thioesterase